ETELLLKLLRRLANEGVGILYISHKLNEIMSLADRVTVLRDGKYVGTDSIKGVHPDDLIRMMVGRDLGVLFPQKSKQIGTPLLEVKNVRIAGSDAKNSFRLYHGEVLGLAGLIGSGRTELARALFGAEPIVEGEIILNGEEVKVTSPKRAIELGIGYLPEDRKAAGLFLEMSLKLNVAATVIDEVSSGGFVVGSKERKLAEEAVQQLDISTPTIEQ